MQKQMRLISSMKEASPKNTSLTIRFYLIVQQNCKINCKCFVTRVNYFLPIYGFKRIKHDLSFHNDNRLLISSLQIHIHRS